MHTTLFTSLSDLDARIKIILALSFGILAWSSHETGLYIYATILGLLCASLFIKGLGNEHRSILKAGLIFVLFWTLLKAGVLIWDGEAVQTVLREAGIMGLRLGVLLLCGLSLAMSTSPRDLGLALNWYLRPVLGKRSWTAALALALMVHFIPLVWNAAQQVQSAIRLRAARLGFVRRTLLFPQVLLRTLSRMTWNQTVAVAARGLDNAEAWEPKPAPKAGYWLLGLGIILLGVFCARL